MGRYSPRRVERPAVPLLVLCPVSFRAILLPKQKIFAKNQIFLEKYLVVSKYIRIFAT